MNNMENSLASILKWLVAWKWGLPNPNVSNEYLSPSPTVSYSSTENKIKRFLAMQKSLGVLKLLRVFLGYTLGFTMIGSSLGPSLLFFRNATIFYFLIRNKCFFYCKQMFCFIFSTKTLHLTISSDKKWKNTCMIQTRKRMSSISGFINYLYCWIYSSYILHKKLNKIFQEPVGPILSF